MIITSIPDYDASARNGKQPEKESSREPDNTATGNRQQATVSGTEVVTVACSPLPVAGSEATPDEWLTIAEIARLLGVDQKQVRRWRDKLDEADRTGPGHVPQRLNLSAVLELRQQGLAGRQSIETTPDEIEGTCPGHVLPALLLALLTANAQQEARIRELNETLAHEREVTNTMMKALPPAPEHTSTTPEQTSGRRWWRFRRRT